MDCGNNPCDFAVDLRGQRTSGRCRCWDSLPKMDPETRVAVRRAAADLRTALRKAEAERDEARDWNRRMVEKACEMNNLEGYLELGAKCAQLEEALATERAARIQAEKERDAARIDRVQAEAERDEARKDRVRWTHETFIARERRDKAELELAIALEDRERIARNQIAVLDGYESALSTERAARESAEAALEAMRARKDAAYLERNQVVAALAKCFPSGTAKTAIEGWSDDWHGCVYIDLPTGQVSWHYHDSHAHLFADLPRYHEGWDGHDTPEKYRRLAALRRAMGDE